MMEEDRDYNIEVVTSGIAKVRTQVSVVGGAYWYETSRLWGFIGGGATKALAIDDLEYKIQRFIEASLEFREAIRG